MSEKRPAFHDCVKIMILKPNKTARPLSETIREQPVTGGELAFQDIRLAQDKASSRPRFVFLQKCIEFVPVSYCPD